MNEEEVGKVGGSRKKLFAGIVVVVIVVAGVGAAVWWKLSAEEGIGTTSFRLTLYFDTQYSESEWIITLVNITTNTGDYYADPNRTKYSTAIFIPSPKDPNAEIIWDADCIYNISNSESPFGLKWHDVGNDNLLKVGDYLTVNKSGGEGGKLEANYYVDFITDYGYSPRILLPPADFLNMSVEKTSDGWNMTVTYVNETIPDCLMMWPNMTDQIEDLSGNVVKVTYGPINHPYNFLWHDIDNSSYFSIGDVIEIKNTDNEIESGYTYRLMSRRYGYMHTMIVVTLN